MMGVIDMAPNWEDAPLALLAPPYAAQLLAYVEHGRPPEAFLTAVLSNNLRETLRRYPDLKVLKAMLEVIDQYVPSGAWGSDYNVEDWIRRGGLGRRPSVHRLRPEDE
jgi:hypothetical protein